MDVISVLIVDDHTVAREGLRSMLETSDDVQVVGEAADGLEALEQIAALNPAVVLMDVRMPKMDGLEAVRRIKREYPLTSVIIMTSYDDDALVVDAVRSGASGYLLKDASRDLLCHTIAAVANGGLMIKAGLLRKAFSGFVPKTPSGGAAPAVGQGAEQLSEREQTVLRLLAEGHTNKEIAEQLALAEVTVKKHVQAIIAKLGVADRTHAATTGMRMGLIS